MSLECSRTENLSPIKLGGAGMGARKPKQLEFKIKTWGGKRRRAGRKTKEKRKRVSHRARAKVTPGCAVHVTLRVREGLWNLRGARAFAVLSRCFERARDRFGFRLIHFSVQGNHLHLLVEPRDNAALARGVQGLAVRVAKGLNRLMGRRGPVFADHFHSRVLRTPTEAARARDYVLNNFAHHAAQWGAPVDLTGPDALSSAVNGASLVVQPRTWLMSVGWRRGVG
jgi:putative transposase